MSNIAGAGEEGREGWREGTCFPVFQCLPYLPPPSYLVLEVLIQNGEFYININMQKVDSDFTPARGCTTSTQTFLHKES